jgi:hypothetical protein
MPHWPVPPKQLAQAALGGGLLGFARIEKLEEIDPERGIARVHAGAVEAVTELLDGEYRRTMAGLKQFETLQKKLTKAHRNTAI